MEMRRKSYVLRYAIDEFRVGLDAVDRREAKPFQRRQFREQTTRETAKGPVAAEVGAKTREVHPCKHDLALARGDEFSRLSDDLQRLRRARRAAPERNDAKCAAMIAAVLDGEESARRPLAGADRSLR